MMEKLEIIILEGDKSVSNTLSLSLSNSYTIKIMQDTREGLKQIILDKPDIIIIDLNTPGIPGVKLVSKLTSIGVKAPIFILSKDNTVKTKLEYYDLGVNEYLIKPFSLGELKAKLNITSKRLIYLKSNPAFSIHRSSLILNQDKMSVSREHSKEIILRRKEYAGLLLR